MLFLNDFLTPVLLKQLYLFASEKTPVCENCGTLPELKNRQFEQLSHFPHRLFRRLLTCSIGSGANKRRQHLNSCRGVGVAAEALVHFTTESHRHVHQALLGQTQMVQVLVHLDRRRETNESLTEINMRKKTYLLNK